jgi:glutamate N-acetyltransferase / amino-acid N-acetyltransferase
MKGNKQMATIASELLTKNKLVDPAEIQILPTGGITAPKGFVANGLHAGIKKKKKDLAIIHSQKPASLGAVFTTNTVKAAPILWSQQVLASGNPVSGIVVNSGNANACTGTVGMIHTRQMAEMTSASLQCKPEEVLVASTGVIGVPLVMEPILVGIEMLGAQLQADPQAAQGAAEAILTTDTFIKEIAVRFELDGIPVTIGAMAKGSGMIHPNMATMLAFVTTDTDISPDLLQKALVDSVNDSYHMISVDGDTSTNDMVSVMANGMAGNAPIVEPGDHYQKFCQALDLVNQELAKAIAKDGEGATKFLSVTVHGASNKADAQKLAKAVVSSSLVKSAAYGEDANWGRVLAAMGSTEILFDPERVDLSMQSTAGNIALLKAGQPIDFDEAIAKKVLQEKNIEFFVDLHQGEQSAIAWGCDLSHDYVSINRSYRI